MQRRRRNTAGWPNETEEWRKDARAALEVHSPLVVETGTPGMRQLAHTNVETYFPTLGGYPLQREKLGAWSRSVDNLREITEQLGKPFWIEATTAGILFHWNGTFGGTESFLAMGFVLGVRHKACRALADICAELGHGETTANRRRFSGRTKRMFVGTLFHVRSIRTRDVPSRKHWPEMEAVLA